MKFHPTGVEGLTRIEIDRISDDRGFFARAWCEADFAAAGLDARWVQANVGWSRSSGTLRGLHFQRPPFAEVKLVRCTRGSIYDVAVDLRPSSLTYGKWVGFELRADRHTMLYVPEGCAHGYLTLEDDSEVFYSTSKLYAPEAASGVRYDDPTFEISWPAPIVIASAQDRGWAPWEL